MAEYNLGTASGRIVVDGSAAETGFRVAQTAAGAFFDVVKIRAERVRDLGKKLTAVGVTGSAAFGLAIKTAADFEQAMSGVFAVANASEDQMEALRQKALDLGKDTQFSATEAASALEELVKAGISVEDALNGAADATVALAAAGGIGLPEAATISANAMNQFELSAKNLPKVADILAGVANTSAADVTSLGTSLAQAGAVANLSGLSFRDTAIALGEMADAGIQGSDAGTSLKTFLNNLIPTTDKQKAKFRELGLVTVDLANAQKALAGEGLKPVKGGMDDVRKSLGKYVESMGKGTVGSVKNGKAVDDLLVKYGGLDNKFFDAKGNIKELGKLQGVLGDALKGQTKEQKLANLELLFGADAMRASAILSLDGAEGYKTFNGEVKKTSAADVAKVRMDNLAGATEQLSGSLETAKIIIGNVFLPIITKMVNFLTKLVNVFNNLPKQVQVGIAVIAGLASVMSALLGIFILLLPAIIAFVAQFFLLRGIGVVTAGFRTFYKVQKTGVGVMAASRAAMAASATRATKLGKTVTLLGKTTLAAAKVMRAAWLIATGPIGIAISIIVALVALGVLLYKKWAPFRNLVDSIAETLRKKMQQAWTAMQPAINAVVAALKRFGAFLSDAVLPTLLAVGKALKGQFLSAVKSLVKQVMTSLVPAAKELTATFTGDVVPALGKLWEATKPVLVAIAKFGALVGGFLLKVIVGLGKAFITYVLPILIKVAGFIGGVLIDTLKLLISGVINVVTGVIKIFTGLMNFFTGLFTGNWKQMWEGIKQIFVGAFLLILGLAKIYFAVGFLKVLKLGFALLKAAVKLGWRALVAIFRGAGSAVLGIVRKLFGWIPRLARAAWNAVTSSASKAWGNLTGIVTRAIGKVVTAAKNLKGRLTTGLSNVKTWLYNMGRDLIQGFIDGIGNMAGQLLGKVKSMADSVKNAFKDALKFGSPSKVFRQYGEWTVEGNIEGIEEKKKQLAQSAREMAKTLIDGYNTTLKPASLAMADGTGDPLKFTPRATRKVTKKSGGPQNKMRIIEGKLSIDRSGRAFIKGVARDEDDENERFETTHGRMDP